MKEQANKWIQKALSDKGDRGRLHRALGIKEGEKIPSKILNEASKRSGKIGQMARMAKNMRGFSKKKKRS